MEARHKWMVGAGVLATLAGAAWLALALWLPNDASLAARAATELQRRLGVPVTVGALRWQLLPVPAVVLIDMATQQPQAITAKKITVYPNLAALLDRRLIVNRLELDGAVVPQVALRALDQTLDVAHADVGRIPLARLVFRELSWVSRRGVAVVYEGEVDFDPAWRPRTAQLRRPGVQPATDLALSRQGPGDVWTLRIHSGGGTAHGKVQLQTSAKGRLQLDGQLQPREIELTQALAAFNRRSVVAGKVSGETTLSASGDTLGQLAQSLHTQTRFTMGRATLLRLDLDKAIRSFGQNHEGQTALDAVAGQLDTQNTPQGMVVTYTGITARSGALTATGQARIANRQIAAEFAVDLVDGVVGVPLQLSGPLDKVKVSVPRGVVAGAVLGTAVLPGVGTAIGARLGATLGKLFSSPSEPTKGGKISPGKSPP
ncbi:AsmA-like C-terminal region-containing protein [Polaromonas sp. SM01]|uniref:AsmA-like C-terminal region-containing protein n=1 Tax=Polaromonas sp. SM01 TaxID=3085630 RepID=UPI002981D3DB|nr:AsmA-like C-terminal region-containing protein [Polaromonas sp. SM01]MDW5441332.1 AsmA-like C-terminal region-containing protein [Polaromonas sp. SM01]